MNNGYALLENLNATPQAKEKETAGEHTTVTDVVNQFHNTPTP